MRNYIGIALLIASLVGGLKIFSALIEGDRVVSGLVDTYGARTLDEWYRFHPAEMYIHENLGSHSETIYMAPMKVLAFGLLGFIGLAMGVQRGKRALSLCSISLAILLFGTLALPIVSYGKTIDIVSRLVE